MTSTLEKLRLIPVNKTVVFYSPIEGKNIVVRTGTIDNNSFLHSILHAYSKKYISMDIEGKTNFVNSLNKSLSSELLKKKWKEMSNDIIIKIPFQENINNILLGIYYYIKHGKTRQKNTRSIIKEVISDKNINAYKLIIEIIPFEKHFEKKIFPTLFNDIDDLSIEQSKPIILKYITNYFKKLFDSMKNDLDDDRINNYVNKFEILISSILNEAESLTYNNYLKSTENTSIDVDYHLINLISKKFNRDLYFIDSGVRLPYIESTKYKVKGRKSIILMSTGNSHYEVIGRLLPGNRIQREFDYSDTIIDTIHTFLYNPVNIPVKFPLLTTYLSKDIRKDIGVEISDSSELRNSDNYKSDIDGKNVDSDSDFYEKDNLNDKYTDSSINSKSQHDI